jgi:acetyl esterase/lipase
MRRICAASAAVAAVILLTACGSDSTTSSVASATTRGTLVENPPFRIASLDAADFQAQLGASSAGAQLLQLTGAPACGVDFYYLKFWTVGGAGETTESSGALMVPTGAAPACSGPRPIVLYAHATEFNKLLNIADITNPDNTEGALIAAMFAAQGYIVVAPNYAGYDISTLGYHPFLDATQQSGEMMDILSAARSALPHTFAAATTDSGQLLVAGYSEGGHVAVATVKALEAAGQTVTAASGGSGPYALEAFGDVFMFGDVNVGATEFAPLLTTSYQHEYGNLYSSTSDLYSSTYATGIDTLLPSATPIDTLFADNLLPETALFDSTPPTVTVPGNAMQSAALTAALAEPSPTSSPQAPIFDLGFGNPYLVNNSVRVDYALDAASDPDGEDTPLTGMAASPSLAAAAPSYPLRTAFYLNDMRYWYGAVVPGAPLLMCGGENDPTVFYAVNTGTMAAFWSAVPTVSTVDVDPSSAPSGPYAAIQTAFQASQAQELAYLQTAAGGGLSASAAEEQLIEGYHSAVDTFCALAARAFFTQVLAE